MSFSLATSIAGLSRYSERERERERERDPTKDED